MRDRKPVGTPVRTCNALDVALVAPWFQMITKHHTMAPHLTRAPRGLELRRRGTNNHRTVLGLALALSVLATPGASWAQSEERASLQPDRRNLALWPEDYQAFIGRWGGPRFVTVNIGGGRTAEMHYVDTDPGNRKKDSVLFVHGIQTHTYLWREQISALHQAGLRVIAVDSIGYGQSDRPSPAHFAYTAQAQAD
ncbi:MAG: alpha/beta fold hydrolase, partial [Myxococcota bacterium]